MKKKEDGTKNVDSYSIDIITTTSKVISNKKNESRSTENTIVEKYTVRKNNNTDKSDSNDQTIKNLNDNKGHLQDNDNLNLHSMATVQFFH